MTQPLTIRPLTDIIDDVLAGLASEGFSTSPGVQPDQATARAARRDTDAPFVGYIDRGDTTQVSLFHDVDDVAGQRILDAIHTAGLIAHWPDRSPDLRIDVTRPQ